MPSRSGRNADRHFIKAVRGMILGWPCLLPSTSLMSFIVLLTPGGFLAELPLWLRALAGFGNLGLFLAWSWLGVTQVLLWAWRRGWPILPVQTAFYLPFAIGNGALAEWLAGDQFTLSGWVTDTIIMVVMIALASALGLFLFMGFALEARQFAISARQIILPHQGSGCRLQEFLPEKVKGKVLQVSAARQQIVVRTESGEAVLRRTLSDALTRLPKEDGLRVHRSHWVAWDFMEDLFFENGNPRLRIRDGTILPLSRSTVPGVQTRLSPPTE